jgi:hypothetical protein
MAESPSPFARDKALRSVKRASGPYPFGSGASAPCGFIHQGGPKESAALFDGACYGVVRLDCDSNVAAEKMVDEAERGHGCTCNK